MSTQNITKPESGDDPRLVVRDRKKALRVTAWILAGLAIHGFQYELPSFGRLFCGAYLLVAAIATVIMLVRQNITGRGSAVMAVAIVSLFFYGNHVVRLARFYALKSGYLAVVQDVERGLTDEKKSELRRSGIFLDEDGPVRIAFPWMGIVDNWCGVVFDPTDQLANYCGDAGQDTRGFLKDPSLRKLFGGDITRCERLEKGWYFCWFT